MTNAYNKNYLNNAMNSLGAMFDVAVNEEKIEIEDFTNKFLTSNISKLIENGDPTTIVGKSPLELLYEILDRQVKIQTMNYDRSPEFWVGYVLAYAQWWTNNSFAEIIDVMPVKELLKFYPTLHEADIQKTADFIDERLKKTTKLKQMRLKRQLSQSQLAILSGVKLRTIKSYEQKELDINKAQAETLLKFAKTLCCSIEDLLD